MPLLRSIKKASKLGLARQQYMDFLACLVKDFPKEKTQTGIFAANMQVDLVNQGPVTIVLDTKNKE